MSDTPKKNDLQRSHTTSTDNLDDLEVATDFDDLNLEIVSEKPAASSVSSSVEDSSSPSIDEFVIAKQDQPQTERQSTDQWFVKVLGQEMGPFPFEDLVMLVVGEEVGPGDQLRHTMQGDWMVAGNIAGLFPEIESDFELGGGAKFYGDNNSAGTSDSPDFEVVGGELNHILSDVRPKGTAPEKPPEQEIPQHAETEPSDAASESSKTEEEIKEEAEVKRKQEIANRLNAWLGDRVEEPEPVAIVREPQSEQSTASPIYPAAFDPNAASNTPARPGPPPKFKKVKQPREKIDFSGITNLIDAKVLGAVGVVIAFAVVYFFMPNVLSGTNDKKIYERYKEIYAQIQRAREGNPGQIKTIAKEVVPELKEMVIALENAGAGAKRPVKQKLFFGGKYCLIPILEKNIAEPGKLDEKFEKYQKEVADLLK